MVGPPQTKLQEEYTARKMITYDLLENSQPLVNSNELFPVHWRTKLKSTLITDTHKDVDSASIRPFEVVEVELVAM